MGPSEPKAPRLAYLYEIDDDGRPIEGTGERASRKDKQKPSQTRRSENQVKDDLRPPKESEMIAGKSNVEPNLLFSLSTLGEIFLFIEFIQELVKFHEIRDLDPHRGGKEEFLLVRIKLGSESVADLRERLKPSLHDGVIMNAATTCMTLSRECTVLWGKIRIIILDPTWSDYPLLSEKPFDRETNALKGHISSLLAKTELIAQDIRDRFDYQSLLLPEKREDSHSDFRAVLDDLWDSSSFNHFLPTGRAVLDRLSRDGRRDETEIVSVAAAGPADDYKSLLSREIYTHLIPNMPLRGKLVGMSILESLQFEGMNDRRAAITEAHQDTFDWIFQSERSMPSSYSNFSEWLQNGSGLYWISGKVASGKSTLMKYLLESPRTKQLLDLWASNEEVITASSFFWYAGTPEQRTLDSLLKTLLSGALKARPDLASNAFPDIWANKYWELVTKSQEATIIDSKYSLQSLKDGFMRLLRATSPTTNFCFFVDGLDEYAGDPEDMVSFINEVSTFPNVKICFSSRPWSAFQSAFGSGPKLKLQDLTQRDITIYVDSELKDAQEYKRLLNQAPRELHDALVTDIVRKGEGVFLWVHLVVQSLTRGLRNGDAFEDLRRRLLCIPSGLDHLYEHILQHIDKSYFQQASQIFRIVSAFQIGTSNIKLTPLDLELATRNETQVTQPISLSSLEKAMELWGIRVKSRTGGLLEVYGRKVNPITARLVNHLKFFGTVEYVHRSVRDFLEQTTARTWIASQDANFDPNTALLKSHALKLGLRSTFGWSHSYIWELIQAAVVFSRFSKADDRMNWVNDLDFKVYKYMKEVLSSSRNGSGDRQSRVDVDLLEDGLADNFRGESLQTTSESCSPSKHTQNLRRTCSEQASSTTDNQKSINRSREHDILETFLYDEKDFGVTEASRESTERILRTELAGFISEFESKGPQGDGRLTSQVLQLRNRVFNWDFQGTIHAESESVTSSDGGQTIFSLESSRSETTRTSARSVSEPYGAKEELVYFLIKEASLATLYERAVKRLDIDRFTRNFSRLLKTFSDDLRTEAKDEIQIQAVALVRVRAEDTSKEIADRLYPNHKKNLEMRRLRDQPRDTALEIERYIQSQKVGTPSLDPNTVDLSISGESDNKQNNHEGDELSSNDEESLILPNLAAVKAFLRESAAFKNLVQNFNYFIKPGSRENIEGQVEGATSTSNIVAMASSDEEAVQENTALLKTAAGHVTEGIDLAKNTEFETKAEEHGGENLSCRTAPTTGASFTILRRVFIRTSLPLGITRIEWTCQCGHQEYDDYLSPGDAVLNLAERMQRSNTNRKALVTAFQRSHVSQTATTVRNKIIFVMQKVLNFLSRVSLDRLIVLLFNASGRDSGPDGSQCTGNSAATFSENGPQISTNSQRNNQNQGEHPENSNDGNHPSELGQDTSTPSRRALEIERDVLYKFLHLCFHSIPGIPSLKNFQLVPALEGPEINCDQEFFMQLKKTHLAERKKWSGVRLQGIHFVRFVVRRKRLVDNLKEDEHPPSHHPEYEYKLGDTEYDHARPGSRWMKHLYHNPDHAGDDTLCYDALPKKKKEPISKNCVGWGVYLKEEPDTFFFNLIKLCVSISAGLLFGVLWNHFHSNDQESFPWSIIPWILMVVYAILDLSEEWLKERYLTPRMLDDDSSRA